MAMAHSSSADQVIFEKARDSEPFLSPIERGKVALESSTGDDVVKIDEVGAWATCSRLVVIFPPYVVAFRMRAPSSRPQLSSCMAQYCGNIGRGQIQLLAMSCSQTNEREG